MNGPSTRRRWLPAALLALVAATPAFAGGEVHRQLLAEPESLDPQLITGSTDFDVVDDLFEGLTAWTADGKIIPGAAASWDMSADRLAWIFHLRPGLAWSDGTKLTSGDFVYAMRRAVDPATASPYAAALLPLRNAREITEGKAKPEMLGVSAPDEHTLRLELVEPTPFLPGLMAQPIAFPLPRAAIERWSRDWTRPEHMVSDGPFKLARWVPQAEITLEKNPNYHDAATVGLDRVRWLLADDRRAGLRRYRAGELDSAALAAEDYNWATTEKPNELRSVDLLATRYLVVNMNHDPLGHDERLREALSLALDRDLLVARIDTRGQRAAWGLVPDGIEGYSAARFAYASQPAADRLARAKQLLADATGGKRLKISLMVERDDIDHRIAEGLRALWQSVLPVDVTLDETEWRVFNAAYHQGNYEVALAGWYADYADAWNFLADWRTEAGPLNAAGYKGPEFDRLMDRARRADGAERLSLLSQAEARLLADHPIIPVEFVVSQKLVSPRLKGWGPDPFDMNMSRYLSLGD